MIPPSKPNELNARDLLSEYIMLYRKSYGLPYPVSWAKHTKILKRMLTLYGVICTRQLLHCHLKDTSEFVDRTGHSIETLPSQVPRYLQEIREAESRVIHGDDDFKRLQELLEM